MSARITDDPVFRQKKYVFRDRLHAGEILAEKLGEWRGSRAVVLAIPSGGVPVGYVVAKKLGVPFELAIVRKVPIPWEPEAGFGAVTWDGLTIFNEPLLTELDMNQKQIEASVGQVKDEVKKRMEKFRREKKFPDLSGGAVIVVDDGLASGYTMVAAITSIRRHAPKEVIVAVPTASTSALDLVSAYADQIICLNIRDESLYAVADAYQKWYDLSDEEVMQFLEREV